MFSANKYSFFSIICFVVALVLRLVMLINNVSVVVSYLFYALICVGLVFVGLGSFRFNTSAPAFDLKNSNKLGVLSYLTSIGFFVDFVKQCVNIYISIDNDSYKKWVVFLPICLLCVCSLLSSFYFFNVGMSLGNNGYDFRNFKALHIAPVIWSVGNILAVINHIPSPIKELDSFVKLIVIIFSAGFFYAFVSEIENDSNAKKSTVFLSKAFGYIGLTYFVDRLMLLITGKASVDNMDGIYAVSILLISVFAINFARNIIKNSNLSKGA